MKKILRSPYFFLFFAIVLYVAGACLIKRADAEPLKDMGVAEQEEYHYWDRDGEKEYEGKTLLRIDGVGKVLTYEDVYWASAWMWFWAMGIGFYGFKRDELESVIFANCILGIILVWITSKENIIPTILFWLGIISAGIGYNIDKE